MIMVSWSFSHFNFEQNINEKFPYHFQRNLYFFPTQPQCSPEADTSIKRLRPNDTPTPVAMIVKTNFRQFIKQANSQLLLFNFGIWIIGTVAGYFFIARLLRPAKKQAQAQEDFIANASHELKTPITTIKTELALLKQEKLPSALNNSLNVIHNENQALQNLVDKLLLATVNPATIITKVELISLINSRLKVHQKNYHHQKLTFNLDSTAKINIYTDKNKLAQTLDLLLDNAGKYSYPNTTVTIKVTPANTHTDISITNLGFIIPAKDHQKIFRRFYRVTDHHIQAQNGSGLGLAIAKQLIHDLNGELILERSDAKATRFKITLKHA
jgi:signal transduction histidine kinase